MRFYTFKDYYENEQHSFQNDVKRSFFSVLLGLSITAFSAILWFITELNCKKNGYDWMKYTFAHGLWHIGMPYGYYHIMTFFIYMRSLIKGNSPYYIIGETQVQKKLYYFLPVIDCRGSDNKELNNIILNP